MEEDLSKFELNNDVLKDFDSLMKLHLDQIKELTITSISNNSKFYNIIGLCTNLNTLKIVGNLKINTNNIISNIFQPKLIETFEFDGVRLPTIKSISKFTNLKSIEFKNIKYSSIKGFISNIHKDSVENLLFENTDFCKAPISIIKDFKNLKNLEIKNCENCKFDNYSFLSENYNLNQVIINPAYIAFDQISNFVKGKSTKIVSAQLGKTTKKSMVNKFFINKDEIKIVINSSKLKDLAENLNFNTIDLMVLNLNQNADLVEYMKLLKRVKKEIIISIENVSNLNIEDALFFKEQLNVKRIKLENCIEDGNIEINDIYDIDQYIEIRKRIDELTKAVLETGKNDLENLINIYKAIILSEKKELQEPNVETKNQLNNIVYNIYNDFNYANLLANCLKCVNIPVKIIKGKDRYSNTRYWNQVKIYDYWYNVDLYLDSKNNIKNKRIEKKPKYFLVTDAFLYKNREAQTDDCENCIMEIDKKVINSYFKTDEKENFNWLSIIFNKIKKIFMFNQKAQKALPEANLNRNDENNKMNQLNDK